MGSYHQVNFIGDDIVVKDFACFDLSEAAVEGLWAQLPDVVEELPELPAEPTYSPELPLPLSLLCAVADRAAPVWSQLQGLAAVGCDTGIMTVYTDGSLQGAGSMGCCGGAGVVVLDGDKPLQEVAVQLRGWLSSTKAEIYACIAALVMFPPSQPVQVYTDSQGLISGYKSFVIDACLQPFRFLL